MSYLVREIFYSLQGEGLRAGRPAVFCRFSGCNLWSGREEDRASAACPFCDTDFVGGERYGSTQELVQAIRAALPPAIEKDRRQHPYVVLTGGEPTLQVDGPLLADLHLAGFEIAMESNGTRPVLPGLDWLAVSPKMGTRLLVTAGDELKLVWPQERRLEERRQAEPDELLTRDFCRPEDYEGLHFKHFVLQPRDEADPAIRNSNIRLCIDYCLNHPKWRLGVQLHKMLGLR